MLDLAGYRVVMVPHYLWEDELSESEMERYLREKLAGLVQLPGGPEE